MRRGYFLVFSCGILLISLVFARGQRQKSAPVSSDDWRVWGGAPDNSHYSPLAQINRSNVKQLEIAWTFDTGEKGGLQTSPLIVGGNFYAISPTQKIFALNAATGDRLWSFDSGIKGMQPDRGLTYWSDGQDKRIFVGIMNFLYALDAPTGKPIPSFGNAGRIDLQENLGREPRWQSIALTSPAVVYKDFLIVGGRNPETLPAPPGDIRAYDVRSGKLRWSFHTIPHHGEFGYETWPKEAWMTSGAANNWAGMTSIRGVASFMSPQDQRRSISMEPIDLETICLLTACSLSMPKPVSASGTSRRSDTTYGIGISHLRLFW